ncbi:M23 family metallopeptidase [Calidifontibacter sp. DB0510]|uniref:M23 family metallopeptidase n=1 Tax=Metallococcus carri TaxID=1656884 RepID=A0A967AWP7_9MICO|nr:M23 family metallopeptidase [Metallococcus carri]NHN54359.1 M23 family metallopeptidase [Metallococcus carri]NOP36801.1 M23 family metallopeptidase [Calidifontibacter sp. DB2511S]
MVKKLALAALALVFLAPSLVLVGVGVVMNPAASASCTVAGTSVRGGDVPDELEVTTANGETFTLNNQQLTHAATIIETGSGIDGITHDGLAIALMAALTESTLRMLSNTSVYPESADYPNDGDGSDHDSLGLFQMRPQSGWGTVAELMDPTYQAQAFFGGPTGPNHPSPRGLLDIPGWEQMDKGEAAQAVEVSAYPDRYRNHEPVAETILTTLTGTTTTASAGASTGDATVPAVQTVAAESSRVVFPVPAGTWVLTSEYGPRVHPISGESSFHTGTDFAAPDGTPILAAADGTVTVAEFSGGYGGLIVIEHTLNGQTVATAYGHMWETGIHVQPGDTVTAGQHIGDIGSSGNSTGPHLHFEVRTGGTDGEHTDPAAWLNAHDAADLPEPETGTPAGCDPATATPGGDPAPVDGEPDRLVDDPTSGGQITARMLHLYQQGTAAFSDTSWACYSPRRGTRSEHPLGRACDLTFGNAIGQHPTPAQLEAGWEVTNWMKDHAETLGVEYLIWQGKIWSLARDAEGWRDYTGGGMHDPGDVTGGHYDHLHVTVRSN